MRDYYFELGVAPSDEKEVIRKAFSEKSRKMSSMTEKEQRALVEAWKVIQNDDTRKEYDAQVQFQLRKTSPRLAAAGVKKKSGEKVPFRWGIPIMEILMMPFKKEEEAPTTTPEEEANMHFTQGVLLAADPGGLQKAKEEFKTVLEKIPDLREAQYNYAIMCYRLGQFKEALECFREYSTAEGRDMLAKKMISLLE